MATADGGPRTLGSLLAARLAEEPDAEACRLVDLEGGERAVTVRTLVDKARAYAGAYGAPASPSDRRIVAVCLYHGLDLLAAFLGALWAGHVPTMLPPPSPRMEAAKYSGAFERMLEHIRPGVLVVDEAAYGKLGGLLSGAEQHGRLLRAEAVPDRGDAPLHPADPDDVALLQHSSGTTGLQKGIALSHRAVLEHGEVYARRIGLGRDDTIATWLPLYHDMGLVACFLLPIQMRARFVQISPFDWVLRPALLLEKIHAHRATFAWLPNFAYAFLAESVRDESLSPGLDLSCVRAFVNCSEPVQHRSHAVFVERFGRFGAHAGQLTASYAMAENVFAVTQSLPGAYRVLSIDRAAFAEGHRVVPSAAPDALSFVSNGAPVSSTQVSVRDGSGAELPEDVVGELTLRGDHRFSGYFRRDDLTAQAMTADGWYRTGDLGFVHQGEVYVTGRKKDLIIIKGRNYYPGDVEAVVAGVEGVAAGRVVAFGLPDEEAGTEKLVILAEPREELPAPEGKRLALRIRNAVSVELDCTPGDVRVVPPRWLVKSTSGKLARGDNRDKYLRSFARPPSEAGAGS
jgi:acyl-CoA synthetase (AMP-forming)/AMP-acid ligase II